MKKNNEISEAIIQYELEGRILEKTVYKNLGQTVESVINYIKINYPDSTNFKIVIR